MRTAFFVPAKHLLRYTLLGLVCVLAAGCSEEAEAPAGADNVEVIEPIANPATAPTPSSEPVELIKPEASKSDAKQADYVAPYPDRTILFEPLRRNNRVARAKSDDNAESVVLMGFANLGTPLVVLSIDGIVAPLGSGEEQAGVKVISISPPMAVLQRGRTRWTATLE